MSAVVVAPHAISMNQRLVFWLKTRVFIMLRLARNAVQAQRRLGKVAATPKVVTLAESVTPLYTQRNVAEQQLELGKVQNLRVLAQRLHGTIVPKGEVFSFWRQVGRPSRGKGFVVGRELRHGCLIPSLAGGICQFTNGLASAVNKAGAETVERHRHSVLVDALAHGGEDATVFWNYVDFKFRASVDLHLHVALTAEHLVIRLEQVT
jgi:vancomycin resistance protein YoaR